MDIKCNIITYKNHRFNMIMGDEMGSNKFLSEFLMITSVKTILFIGILLGLFYLMRILEKKKIKFSKRMFLAILLGFVMAFIIQLVSGFPNNPTEITWINETTAWFGLFGYGFMDLLKMITVPLIFFSIIKVIIGMEDDDKLSKIVTISIVMLLVTTLLASVVAIIVGNLFNLGTNTQSVLSDTTAREVTSVISTLRELLPSNPFKAMVEGNIVGVVIFSSFIGLAMRRLKRKDIKVMESIESVVIGSYKITISITMSVIKFMPYAVIALLANTISQKGITAIASVFDFIIAIYLSIFIMFIIHLFIIALNGLNPIKYLKNVMEPLILAFTSRSSLSTLPVTIETLSKNVGVDEGIASFVGSLGSNAGMNGCAAIYPTLIAITLGNMAGITMDFSFYAMLLVIVVISSLGIAGVPGTATIAVSVVISGMGMGEYLPLVGAIIAIDPILDMGRTMLNVSGTMVVTVSVAKRFNKIKKIIDGDKKEKVILE